jgi:hypothetical protein
MTTLANLTRSDRQRLLECLAEADELDRLIAPARRPGLGARGAQPSVTASTAAVDMEPYPGGRGVLADLVRRQETLDGPAAAR